MLILSVLLRILLNVTYSLKVVPQHDLQQQQAREQKAEPAQQTASVAIDKHIFNYL